MKRARQVALVLAGCLAALAGRGEGIAVQGGQTIAFLGDSITAQGMRAGGYVRLVVQGLAANGVQATALGAGRSGNTSRDMLARLDADVLAKRPDWLAVSCGVNDVWHGARGVPLDAFRTNIARIVERAQAAGVQVVILTATMIHEDPTNAFNRKLAAYNDALRELAQARSCRLADLNAAMQAALAEARRVRPPAPGENVLTRDGVHQAAAGNRMMALGVLEALGLDAAQRERARAAWAQPSAPRSLPRHDLPVN